jgi:hypothetical protein
MIHFAYAVGMSKSLRTLLQLIYKEAINKVRERESRVERTRHGDKRRRRRERMRGNKQPSM